MKIGLLCIGDELLRGSTINTNLGFLGDMLVRNGLELAFCLEVPDETGKIITALELAMEKADIVITSGGLGPTADDVTKEAVAQRFGARLEQHGEVAIGIRKYWKSRHAGEPGSRILNQSLVPIGAKIYINRNGTAPGIQMQMPDGDKFAGRRVIMLPGPPGEIQPMFTDDILPELLKMCPDRVHTRMYRICSIGESGIEERILPLLSRTHALSAAYCATHEFVKLFLSSRDMDSMETAVDFVKKEFGRNILAAESPAADVVALLQEKHLTLATAESCTGGLVSKQITDISGASAVFPGGVTAYANEIKEKILGVSSETLKKHGAVSAETAREMVCGVTGLMGTDCGISLTGIAGPGGGTPEKPVGLVYAGIKCRDKIKTFEMRLARSREQIRERAAASALNELRMMLLELE